jgi:probable F420-dependent oxidoreductase
MQLGMALPQRGPTASPDNIVRAATEAERLGLDSVWVMDRLLRPLRPVELAPGGPTAELPAYYATVFDPIETLSHVAAVTERVLLGTSAINALLQPPVVLARRLATLDQLSGGRVIAGLAQGWLADEFTATGVPMARRGAGMADYIGVLRAVWGQDPVTYEGRFYDVPASEIGPKPAQPAGIPILVAGSSPDFFFGIVDEPAVGPATIRAGEIADGLNTYQRSGEALVAEVTAFREAARAAGRDPDRLPIVARMDAVLADHAPPGDQRPLFTGTVGQWADDIARMDGWGIDHVILDIDAPLDAQLDAMDDLRRLTR